MRKKRKTFDEVFKNRCKQFFEKFAIVKTEVEIFKQPKKVDLLIVEADKPIHDYLQLFDYFRKNNIIEFKSESDRFRIRDLFKVGVYINGILLAERKANQENTTFTLITTNKPGWLFEKFRFREIKKGLYVTNEISIIEVHVVLTGEIDSIFGQEYDLLKIFKGYEQRQLLLPDLLEKANEVDLEDLFILFDDEIIKLLEREGKNMTAIQERVMELADKYGVSQKVLDRGKLEGKAEGLALAEQKARRAARKEKLRTAINMKKKNLDLELIASVTELEKKYLVRFFGKIK